MRQCVLYWFALCALIVPAWAQGTRADYERANGLRSLTENKVFRDRVKANWLPDNHRFWYRVSTGSNTFEFILVDAEKGLRQPAFDHARLASALTKTGVKEALPERLPIDKLEYSPEGQWLGFRCEGKSWRCLLDSYELSEQTKVEKAAPLRNVPKASTKTGPETTVVFVNQTPAEMELFWLDAAGQRRSYGKVQPGTRHSQHTFAGHVWLAVNAAGETVGACEAEEGSITVEITGKLEKTAPKPDAPQSREPQRGNAPNGQWQAFIKEYNLWVRNVASGEEFALSQDGTKEDAYGENVVWSPDSRKLAAVRTRQGDDRQVHVIESSPKDQLQPKLHSFAYLKPGDRIPQDKPQLFDLSTRKPIAVSNELFPNPWSITDLRWAPDSSRFTFLYNQRGHQVMRIVAVDAQTGATRPVVDESSATFIDYAGKEFTQYLDGTHEIIWMSERDGWNHLYLYDADTGRMKNQITRGEWVVRRVERVDEATRQVWFRAGGIVPGQDPYYIHYCRINFDGTGLVMLTEGDGTHTVEFSPDRRFLLDTWSRVDQPPTVVLRWVDDGKPICPLERADWSELLKTGWQPPERLVAKGRDGVTDIYGVIFRPSNFDSRKKYPVIEDIYAGPQDSFVPKGFRAYYRTQALAELGFVVVQMDGMGTSNRSKKFHDVCWKNLGDAGLPDRILWIKAAAAQYPYMDLTRVGIYGGSAGGQSSTGALLTHGDFYKVAVSDCGCHDNRMDKIWWNELWMGWPIGPHYAEQSNVTLAHHLTGKLLLIVGEVDHNVDPASTMQVVNALVKADKDFDLLVVPGSDHAAAESPYGNRRRQDFFVRHLLGVEPRL